MSGWLDRLGRRAARHHWWFLTAWLVAAIAIGALAKGLDGHTTDNFRIEGTQSQEAIDLLDVKFPSAAGSTATVVFDPADPMRRAPDCSRNANPCLFFSCVSSPP